MSGNKLSGEIPWKITKLPQLDLLQLQDNNLDENQFLLYGNENVDLALFDHDVKSNKANYQNLDYQKLEIKSETRTVNTQFEDTID